MTRRCRRIREIQVWVAHGAPCLVSSGEAEGRYAAGMRGEVPYHDPRELIGDVLRFGKDCEVVARRNWRDGGD